MKLMLKWIGGATVAVAFTFGGATLAGNALSASDTEPSTSRAPSLVLEVDNTIFGKGEALEDVIPAKPDDPVSDPVTQAVPEVPAAAAPAQTAAPGLNKAAAKQGSDFVIKRILPIEGAIKYGDWHWDDEGVPPGELIVTVDLKARVVSVFQGGYEIGATVAMLGTEEHPTPTGIFPILTKERDNVSEKYDDAPMPWTLRLTWDGIAVHGGSAVENGYASHGCIAVPDEFASRLFEIAKKGDKVIVTDGMEMGMGDSIL